ncbi:hypothetical protein Gotri_027836 [Gossypium trilobum]|uniref:Reverse transcriptase zinc-binding domain-containing protein n=1 Tax=Gossypium trilobum TaxID=34281 RepID=A0A7J9FND7_9ROSI|nr:hypothetical protein [Gossypium trilobum]
MSGEFTVRSAYKLLQRSIDNPRAYALQTIYRNFYKKLWSLNLPTKIKHRKLTVNQSCPRCVEKAETMNHLFRDCPATNEGDRNKRVHEGKVSTGKGVANFINSYLGEITSLERRDLNFTGGK